MNAWKMKKSPTAPNPSSTSSVIDLMDELIIRAPEGKIKIETLSWIGNIGRKYGVSIDGN